MTTIRERLDYLRQQDYVSVKDCALLLGISERTVWRRLPQIAHWRQGRLTRVDRRAAQRFFLQAQARR